ncbi:hypothetical protein BDZ91DRAFT_745775 [Kalaharituber pfeilii]|nr:hypothetical protein BDZ91DRAFT_745775 [Kalaharituber pfeilii]
MRNAREWGRRTLSIKQCNALLINLALYVNSCFIIVNMISGAGCLPQCSVAPGSRCEYGEVDWADLQTGANVRVFTSEF